MEDNDLFLRAAAGERPPRVPVWLMRQAGRSDPAYLRLKEESEMTLAQLFRHPQLSAEISLLPRKLGVDALIFFQDILTLLAPMGAEFTYEKGPRLLQEFKHPSQLHRCEVEKEMWYVPETLRLLQAELRGSLPILGFAGAPLTLAVFLLEGGSFTQRAPRFRRVLQEQPAELHKMLKTLAEMTSAYLHLQLAAGVTAVQLFESAADLLSVEEYQQFALPYQQEVLAALPDALTIIFAKNFYELTLLQAAGAKVISLPAGVSIAVARQVLGEKTVVQGNVSNHLLLSGDQQLIKQAVQACVAASGGRGHILNLDHGILPRTPYSSVRCFVESVA